MRGGENTKENKNRRKKKRDEVIFSNRNLCR